MLKRRFEKGNQFWECTLNVGSAGSAWLDIRSADLGAFAPSRVRRFKSEAAAKVALDKEVVARLKEGWIDTADRAAAPAVPSSDPLKSLMAAVDAAWPGARECVSLLSPGVFFLNLADTRRWKIDDLSPLRGLQVHSLAIDGTFTDLEPLTSLPLTSLSIGTFSGKPGQTPLRKLDGVERLSGLEALGVLNASVESLAPLQGMRLKKLTVTGGSFRDLAPLRGMPLQTLTLRSAAVDDLGPLEGMPLQGLELAGTSVRDISVLTNMPLNWLDLTDTRVSDLSALSKTVTLRNLKIAGTEVTDVSMAAGWPELTFVELSPEKIQAGLDLLRKLKTIKEINRRPARAFWKTLA